MCARACVCVCVRVCLYNVMCLSVHVLMPVCVLVLSMMYIVYTQ